jgi:hypothetical protein
MDWIQENKFVSGLLGVTIVFAGAIFYHGYSEGDDFAANMSEYGKLKSRYNVLVMAKPYPNQANLTAREENVANYESVIEEVSAAFFEYKSEQLPKLTPGEFTDARIKMQTELRKAFNKVGASLPEKCGFGFEKYAAVQAAPYATKKLNFQLGAIEWLLEKLAENEPKALLNIRRELIAVEKGPPVLPSKKKNARGRVKKPTLEEQQILEAMPVEITFTAKESSMRHFLQAMANSKEYLYAIRALRIRNENQNAPGPKDADFKAKQENLGDAGFAPIENNDVFGGFDVPAEVAGENGLDFEANDNAFEAQPDPDLDDEHILKQVMGEENLIVHIKFDILLMKGSRPVSEKEEAGAVRPVK